MYVTYHFPYLLLFLIVSTKSQVNLIKNGGFDLPLLSPNSFRIGDIDSWIGIFIEVDHQTNFDGVMNQFIDMQAALYQNGFLEQAVTINESLNCTISYRQKADSTTYTNYIIEVYWNYQLLATKIANTTDVTVETFQVQSIVGLNVLIFKEVGDDSDLHGMYLDDVSLICPKPPVPVPVIIPNITTINTTQATSSNTTQPSSNNQTVLPTTNPPTQQQLTPEQQNYSLGAILALPFRCKQSLRSLYFIFDDFWLYNYDKREHFGIVNDIFDTIVLLELTKFRFMENFIGFAKYAQLMPLSSYSNYTLSKFTQIEESESVLITSNFPFFIYSIPQNLVLCFILYALFIMTSQQKLSRHLREFYFFRAVLSQNLVQANLSYFTYVCFSHLSHSFTYRFGDKLSLLFTVCFFFLLTVFAFTFYFLLCSFMAKNSGYFIYCYYRVHPGISMLMTQRLTRAFLQGAAHFFLHDYYKWLMVTLSCIEVVIIIIMIVQENRRKVFISSKAFNLQVIYHFLFICFNFSLYFEYLCSYKYEGYEQMRDVALALEEVIVYTYICVLILMLITDLMPKNCLIIKMDHRQKLATRKKKNLSLKPPKSSPKNDNQQKTRKKSWSKASKKTTAPKTPVNSGQESQH